MRSVPADVSTSLITSEKKSEESRFARIAILSERERTGAARYGVITLT